jgi:hypothetical protein
MCVSDPIMEYKALTRPSTVIESRKLRIPSDLRRISGCRLANPVKYCGSRIPFAPMDLGKRMASSIAKSYRDQS